MPQLNLSKTMLLFHDFFPPEVVAYTSDRRVDYTFSDGQPCFTPFQKQKLFEDLQGNLPQTVNIRQVHGNKVIFIDESSGEQNKEVEQADAVITARKSLAIVIRTADCLPIFIYDPKAAVIALVHAGWRGTKKEVVMKTLKKMKEIKQCEPKDIKIAFGPAIRSCCYQVGEEFCRMFPKDTIEKKGGYYLDLPSVNKRKILNYGVPEDNISDSGMCTCCNKNYFSYRGEGQQSGRMLSLMMLKS